MYEVEQGQVLKDFHGAMWMVDWFRGGKAQLHKVGKLSHIVVVTKLDLSQKYFLHRRANGRLA